VRLDFNSSDDFHRQILLGLWMEKATENIDAGYDALNIDDYPTICILNNDNQLVIQGEGIFDTNLTLLG
jgi:hypothetical protein